MIMNSSVKLDLVYACNYYFVIIYVLKRFQIVKLMKELWCNYNKGKNELDVGTSCITRQPNFTANQSFVLIKKLLPFVNAGTVVVDWFREGMYSQFQFVF